jgi:hypothetical protein
MITAVSVPSWVMAVKAEPGSSPPKNWPTIDWCALEEIGRNSVRPCTMPSTRASSQPIDVLLRCAAPGSAPGQPYGVGAAVVNLSGDDPLESPIRRGGGRPRSAPSVAGADAGPGQCLGGG